MQLIIAHGSKCMYMYKDRSYCKAFLRCDDFKQFLPFAQAYYSVNRELFNTYIRTSIRTSRSFTLKSYRFYYCVRTTTWINDVFALLSAFGCSNIIPPEDSWLKRSDDSIVVGCYISRQSWYLVCKDGRWFGTVGNCTYGENKIKFILYQVQ